MSIDHQRPSLALVGPLPGVLAHVADEAVLVPEARGAVRADELLFGDVDLHVDGDVRHLRLAHAALVVLHPRVELAVVLQGLQIVSGYCDPLTCHCHIHQESR